MKKNAPSRLLQLRYPEETARRFRKLNFPEGFALWFPQIAVLPVDGKGTHRQIHRNSRRIDHLLFKCGLLVLICWFDEFERPATTGACSAFCCFLHILGRQRESATSIPEVPLDLVDSSKIYSQEQT